MRLSPRTAALALALAPALAAAGEVNGYLDSRTQLTRARLGGLLPTADLPEVQQLLELNAQVKHEYLERGFVSGDLSVFLQGAGAYRDQDAQGNEVVVPDHDTPAARPLVSLNELYLSQDLAPWLNVLLGKKRVVWGSGLAFNPTDLLNPPKDPTDPSFQRAGAYMARVELPFEEAALTVLFSPAVTEESSGLPTRLLYYPRWDQRDGQAHWLAAGRLYALVHDADVNLMFFYGNRYRDAFEQRPRFGASFSRYFFKDYELHLEALMQQGSVRQFPNAPCLESRAAAVRCTMARVPLFAQTQLDSTTIHARALAGGRYQFPDETLVSIEYLFQSDGYDRGQMQAVVNGLSLMKQAQQLGLANPLPASPSADGSPARFTFEPIGRHYLFVTLQVPKIRDDFTLTLVAMASLQDFSWLFAPSLSWSAAPWLTVTASGFFPFPGAGGLGYAVPDSPDTAFELTLTPMQYRGVLELRLFY